MKTLLDDLGTACNRCGRCCIEAGGTLPGTVADHARWAAAGPRGEEILSRARILEERGRARELHLWVDPGTCEPVTGPCPWVRTDRDGGCECAIYDLRPDACREFPSHHEQIERYCMPGGVLVEFDC